MFASSSSQTSAPNLTSRCLVDKIVSSFKRSTSSPKLNNIDQDSAPPPSYDSIEKSVISAAPPPATDVKYQLDAHGHPIPATFEQLVDLIRAEMGTFGLMDKDQINLPRLQALIQNYKSTPAEWESMALFDKCRYTRNLVDDGNGKYNLLLLCWGAGHASPIHDHANSHCILKVLDGQLVETRYRWPDEEHRSGNGLLCCHPMVQTAETRLESDNTGYMHDTLGLHRIANTSERGAVSLHLYSPPIKTCGTFCEKTGISRESGKCVFYSVRGQKLNGCIAGLTSASQPDNLK